MKEVFKVVAGVRVRRIRVAASLFRIYVESWAYGYHINRRGHRSYEDWHQTRMELGF